MATELDAVKADMKAVLAYAVDQMDDTTITACGAQMTAIKATQSEIDAEGKAIAAMPHPPGPATA